MDARWSHATACAVWWKETAPFTEVNGAVIPCAARDSNPEPAS